MTKHTREPGIVPLLKLVLADMPSLPDAACAGRHELFDPQGGVEDVDVATARHRQARALCRACPVLAPCGAWVDSQSAHDRPAGVVAGRMPQRRQPGRPPGGNERTSAPRVDDREAAR